jgi:DNA-binding transcriptional ArsR family regulator
VKEMIGVEKSAPTYEALLKVERLLRDNFEIMDWCGLRILLAVAAAHYLPGEPLWLRVIGPSRSGRTEILRALLADIDSAELEALTPASIRGGVKGGARLLARINGKRVITKDLAPLITLRRETRLEIFGLLRSVQDGSVSSDFGTPEGHITQNARFDWILAVTPIIESMRQIESLLGERYIDLHWIPGDRKKMALKAATNNPRLAEIRENLSAQVCALLKRARRQADSQELAVPENVHVRLAEYADSVALCRSPVLKDYKGNITIIPKPEIGTSLAQAFSRVYLGLKLLGIKKALPYIHRLAWDCIPSVRASILQILLGTPQSAADLHEATGLPKSTIYFHLKDLQILGSVQGRREQIKTIESAPMLNMSEEDNEYVVKHIAIRLPPIPEIVLPME